MIQLNLLPDIKLEYIRAERTRRLILSISFIVTAVAVALLIVLFLFDLGQKKYLHDVNRDISSESSELQQKPDIGKILTVQNQLESLTPLHSGKPAASRLFGGYLDQVTPAAVSISDLHADFTTQSVTITGTSDSLATVNKYVDTLKFTTYTTDANKTPAKAFNNVVLSSFGLNTASATDKSQVANYSITVNYDKTIFDITQKVDLSVPNLITTRSELDKPGDLFKPAPTPAPASTTNTGGH
jgi:hypothetical protein